MTNIEAGAKSQLTGAAEESLKKAAQAVGAPWEGNRYYGGAEKDIANQWERLIYPRIKSFDFSTTIDLACGHGRNSAYLGRHAKEIWLIDIQSSNIDACKDRFKDQSHFRYSVNSGTKMDVVPDDWASLLYCFDAMVHFDPDVIRSYLVDAKRVLRPGGHAFLHHSNYGVGSASSWSKNPHARNLMTAEFFAFFTERAGLEVVTQDKIQWGGIPELDCITVLRRRG